MGIFEFTSTVPEGFALLLQMRDHVIYAIDVCYRGFFDWGIDLCQFEFARTAKWSDGKLYRRLQFQRQSEGKSHDGGSLCTWDVRASKVDRVG